MEINQKLENVNDQLHFENEIIVSDVADGLFAAIASNTLPEGQSCREIVVDLMPLDGQLNDGRVRVVSGVYVRGAEETAVKVTVMQNGAEKSSGTTNYA